MVGIAFSVIFSSQRAISQFSRSVVSESLWPHGLQHARLPCLSPIPGACSNSWRWCHPTISSSVIPFSCLQSFPVSKFFQWVSSLYQVAKVLELKLQHQSPSNKFSGLISLRMDWLDILVVRHSQDSSPTPQFRSINSSVLSFLYGPSLTSIYDYWKSHSFD